MSKTAHALQNVGKARKLIQDAITEGGMPPAMNSLVDAMWALCDATAQGAGCDGAPPEHELVLREREDDKEKFWYFVGLMWHRFYQDNGQSLCEAITLENWKEECALDVLLAKKGNRAICRGCAVR